MPRSAPGLQVKINTVALKGVNDDEFDRLIGWCGEQGFDLTLIEVMPMGDIGGETRIDQYLPLSLVRGQSAAALDARTRPITAPAARRATTCARDRTADRLHHADDA